MDARTPVGFAHITEFHSACGGRTTMLGSTHGGPLDSGTTIRGRARLAFSRLRWARAGRHSSKRIDRWVHRRWRGHAPSRCRSRAVFATSGKLSGPDGRCFLPIGQHLDRCARYDDGYWVWPLRGAAASAGLRHAPEQLLPAIRPSGSLILGSLAAAGRILRLPSARHGCKLREERPSLRGGMPGSRYAGCCARQLLRRAVLRAEHQPRLSDR